MAGRDPVRPEGGVSPVSQKSSSGLDRLPRAVLEMTCPLWSRAVLRGSKPQWEDDLHSFDQETALL